MKHKFVGFPDSRSGQQMLVYFCKIDNLYSELGFKVNMVHADPEFEKIRDSIQPMDLIVCEAGAHVKDVTRSSQTHAIPYRAILHVMTLALMWLVANTFNGHAECDGYTTILTMHEKFTPLRKNEPP